LFLVFGFFRFVPGISAGEKGASIAVYGIRRESTTRLRRSSM
jgi:hypothetical protein